MPLIYNRFKTLPEKTPYPYLGILRAELPRNLKALVIFKIALVRVNYFISSGLKLQPFWMHVINNMSLA